MAKRVGGGGIGGVSSKWRRIKQVEGYQASGGVSSKWRYIKQVEVYQELVLFHATSQKPQAFYGQPIKVSSRLTSPDRIDYSSIRLLPARHDT